MADAAERGLRDGGGAVAGGEDRPGYVSVRVAAGAAGADDACELVLDDEMCPGSP